MLTGQEIIAKLISFIVEKSSGKLLGLSTDKRRKACRSLTKLYYCVEKLDEAANNFIQALDSGDDSHIISAVMHQEYQVEMASNMFMDLGWELYEGLEIVDPALANCCHALYVGKFDFLTFLSKSVRTDGFGNSMKVIVKRPIGKMLAVNMERLHAEAEVALGEGEKFYWPESALDFFTDDFEEITIEFEDVKAAEDLRSMIARQNRVLCETKERLRQLIAQSFKIEEILFDRDTSTPRY